MSPREECRIPQATAMRLAWHPATCSYGTTMTGVAGAAVAQEMVVV